MRGTACRALCGWAEGSCGRRWADWLAVDAAFPFAAVLPNLGTLSLAASAIPIHPMANPYRPAAGHPLALQDDATAGSAAALQGAGVKLGTDVLLQLSGLTRGGRDSVHAECKVDPAAEQLSLRKVGMPRGACMHCGVGPTLRVCCHASDLLLHALGCCCMHAELLKRPLAWSWDAFPAGAVQLPPKLGCAAGVGTLWRPRP